MEHFKFVSLVCVALTTFIAAENDSQDIIHVKELLKKDLQDSIVVEDQGNQDTQIDSLRYITCQGTFSSCEDCNTVKLCYQLWGFVYIDYKQCPWFIPYCTSNSYSAWCTNTGPAGCTGVTTPAATTPTTTAAPGTTPTTTAAATTPTTTAAASTTPTG